MSSELSKIKKILHPKKGEDDGAVAKRIRQSIEQIVEGNQDKFQFILAMLAEDDPKAFINTWLQLLEYTTPKISRQEIKQENTNDIIVVGGDAVQDRINALDQAKKAIEQDSKITLKDDSDDQ